MMAGQSQRAVTIAVLLCSTMLYLWCSWWVPFYSKGESREALAVRKVARADRIVVPRRLKPPMYHWLGALGLSAGLTPEETAIRLPSVAFGAGGVALTAALASRLYGPTAGVLSAAVLGSSFEWLRSSTRARVDMTLTFFLVAAVCGWYAALTGASGRRAVRAGYVLGAAAVLTKGPVGLVLPLLIVAVGASVTGNLRRLRLLFDVPGILLAVGLCAGWYGLAWHAAGSDLLRTQFLDENITRFLGTGSVPHREGPFFYFPILAGAFLPWTFIVPWAVRWGWRKRGGQGAGGSRLDAAGGSRLDAAGGSRLDAAGRSRLDAAGRSRLFDVAGGSRWDATATSRHHERFLMAWIVTVFVFYSMAAGKRSVYLLPLYPPLAVLSGAWLASALATPPPRFARTALRATAVAVLVLALWAAVADWDALLEIVRPWLQGTDIDRLPLTLHVLDTHRRGIAATCVVLCLTLIALGARRSITQSGRIAAVMAVAVLLPLASSTFVTRPLATALSPRLFADRVNGVVLTDDDLWACGHVTWAFRYYVDRPLMQFREHPIGDRRGFVVMPATETEERRRAFGFATRLVQHTHSGIEFILELGEIRDTVAPPTPAGRARRCWGS
jgi:4-amino-4-deoxy-L-arabinose transferase-like glycosyltransferase